MINNKINVLLVSIFIASPAYAAEQDNRQQITPPLYQFFKNIHDLADGIASSRGQFNTINDNNSTAEENLPTIDTNAIEEVSAKRKINHLNLKRKAFTAFLSEE